MENETNLASYPAKQTQHRSQLYAAYCRTLDTYWDEAGNFLWKNPNGHGGYRGILWQCLAYLAGDERCVERANRIILTNYVDKPCLFAPGAIVDILCHYRERLWPEVESLLMKHLAVHAPYMSSADLAIQGYNDNHPFKAMHVLVCGGELLNRPDHVALGLKRLRESRDLYARNGFPCEYNSPNYTPVSLQPLASIVEQTKNGEARELALDLERFFWRDLALHFDARAGLPTGPMSRAGVHDYDGQLSHDLMLLLQLFPERFEIHLGCEIFERAAKSRYIAARMAGSLPFLQSHAVWFALPNYHLTSELESDIFRDRTGQTVRGSAEVGERSFGWEPENRPRHSPLRHHLGPHRMLLTTHFGENFSLGTASNSWLDNSQSHAVYATLAPPMEPGEKRDPARAAVYFARHFIDAKFPYAPLADPTAHFRDEGDIRTIQHEGTAVVFYNTLPVQKSMQHVRTGVFRPMMFSAPRQVFVGDVPVPDFNYSGNEMLPIAIDEGDVFVGIIPLRLTDRGQGKSASLQLQTRGDHLSILMSTLEAWSSQEWSYEEIVENNAGFVLEVCDAKEFESFEAFRAWLGRATVTDAYVNFARTTTYRRDGLEISASYSPFHPNFRYATINGVPREVVTFEVTGS